MLASSAVQAPFAPRLGDVQPAEQYSHQAGTTTWTTRRAGAWLRLGRLRQRRHAYH